MSGGGGKPMRLAAWAITASGAAGDPAAAAMAVDAGRRQVAEPGEAGQRGDVAAMPVEHRVAAPVGRDRNQDMADPGQGRRRERMAALEAMSRGAGLARGARDEPAVPGQPRGKHARRIAQPEAQQTAPGLAHALRSAATTVAAGAPATGAGASSR